MDILVGILLLSLYFEIVYNFINSYLRVNCQSFLLRYVLNTLAIIPIIIIRFNLSKIGSLNVLLRANAQLIKIYIILLTIYIVFSVWKVANLALNEEEELIN